MFLLAQSASALAVFAVGSGLLAAGLAIGWGAHYLFGRAWLTPAPDRTPAVELMTQLAEWTSGLSTDMTEYRAVIEGLCQQVAAEAARPQPPSHTVTASLLSQMLAANRRLQVRLEAAEAALAEQAREIAAYMSEARTDALTRLFNRRVFDEQLAGALAAWQAQGTPLSVLLFDVDHFKRLNDTHGHPAGDEVLREMAKLFSDQAPRDSLLARYGGEEFACLVPGLDLMAAAEVADGLRLAVCAQAFAYDREALRITVSAGVAQAMYREDALSLMKRSDRALYAAKDAGRNTVFVHDGYRAVRCGSGDAEAQAEQQLVKDFQEVCEDLRGRLAQVAVKSKTAN